VAEAFGPYVVYEQLGAGGMASVHRAEATGLDGFRGPVALKRMLPSIAENADLVQAFIREARLASYLRHGNVAHTYEVGTVGQTYFIAMELVPGHTLRAILRQCGRRDLTMPTAVALGIVIQICDALDYAHNLCDEHGTPLGIIHRDVSPSNIIVSDSGVVKLIDFGIAKASAVGMQTMSRTIKGKFAYMAPEYIDGSIDSRADLFAVGVIAHELLANRPLFNTGEEMETLLRVKTMPIEPPSRWNREVPPEVDAVVLTALARDPEARWQRAAALRAALATEAKRLGLWGTNAQIAAWAAQAFEQPDEGPITLEPRTVPRPRASPETPTIAADDAAPTRIRPSVPPPLATPPTVALRPPMVGPATLAGPPPVAPIASGARTLVAMPVLAAGASAILGEPPAQRGPLAWPWLLGLLLAIAVLAAVVVYFALG
jgi:serine/threonine-protein kinase